MNKNGAGDLSQQRLGFESANKVMCHKIGHFNLKQTSNASFFWVQPERWLRIRKLEVQGPSNSYF